MALQTPANNDHAGCGGVGAGGVVDELTDRFSMLRRRLKIAWTVFFAVLTVALCVLWVRSYGRDDLIYIPATGSGAVIVASENGELGILLGDSPWSGWHWSTARFPKPRHVPLWDWIGRAVRFPYWSTVVICAAVASIPWLPYRFSLRTMVIVTALVAVVLGLVVWASR